MEWLPWLPILLVGLIAVPAAFRVGEKPDPLGQSFRSWRQRMQRRGAKK
jgi:hypothetical protein